MPKITYKVGTDVLFFVRKKDRPVEDVQQFHATVVEVLRDASGNLKSSEGRVNDYQEVPQGMDEQQAAESWKGRKVMRLVVFGINEAGLSKTGKDVEYVIAFADSARGPGTFDYKKESEV